VIFYVNENKILAGREARGAGEASGRRLVVTFFEAFPGHHGMVRRVDRADDLMRPRHLTVAELLNAVGIRLPHDPMRTSAEAEELLEEAFAEQELRRSLGNLQTGADEVHVYALVDEEHAEETFVRESAFQSLHKIALSKFLERNGRGERKVLWGNTLAALRDEVRPLLGMEPEAADGVDAGAAAGRGGARGGGARGRGGRGAGPALKAGAKAKGKAAPARGAGRGRGRGRGG
jgi:hypothetical protein